MERAGGGATSVQGGCKFGLWQGAPSGSVEATSKLGGEAAMLSFAQRAPRIPHVCHSSTLQGAVSLGESLTNRFIRFQIGKYTGLRSAVIVGGDR